MDWPARRQLRQKGNLLTLTHAHVCKNVFLKHVLMRKYGSNHATLNIICLIPQMPALDAKLYCKNVRDAFYFSTALTKATTATCAISVFKIRVCSSSEAVAKFRTMTSQKRKKNIDGRNN